MKYATTMTVSLAYRKFGKFEGRAPDDTFLVRCFIKGESPDPVAVAREEMRSMLGATEDPVLTRSFAWPDRNPVYAVGHERRVREAEAKLPPGLYLAGSGFHVIGIPDCIKDGRAVARTIIQEASASAGR